ncbi:MAG TPA: galactose-1-phosphate uridylyltransferase [Clostridia bacterium]|jgi:UDPglucose--hexose-1-phosphate uridylyltransferase|nr:MAG: Galactose-1-phosphate uridylyltransferase [Firmicutes bacterium ADurb.Bin146]HOD92465.1 galactose-1-phosphate uridylyltransferase [Clostridia bacterium]HQM38822.1 galactose-1-phosphate uridylyltransferase [Clostridia bacterium]
MAELRWHPLIKDWVMVVSQRQNRPQMPKDWCPFCKGSDKVPNDYIVLKYDNDFPALSLNPPIPDDVETELYKTAPSYGKCEVILYSSDHHTTLPQLDDLHLNELVKLWKERFIEISSHKDIKYIFIFENRGEAVGVTMPHPHGQIYGYPFIPKKLELELDSCKEHMEKTGHCLICDMNREESEFKRRVIFENESFIVYLPFFSEYPYGIYISSKRHIQYITQFTETETLDFAQTIKTAAGTLDSLFGFTFPYMMCMHQAPVNDDCDYNHYHFHVEFFPPMRSKEKIKFNASSETGAWAHCNPTSVEEKADELKQAYLKFMNQK